MRRFSSFCLSSLLIASIALSPLGAGAAVFSPLQGCGELDADLSTQMAADIDDRIDGVTPSTSTKSLFASRGNGSSGWARSTTTWTLGGEDPLDFTGASPWNSDGGYTKAGTLISPRHIILANHYQIGNGSTVIFVDTDNNIVSRTLSSQMRVTGTDIQIGLLSSDVPTSTIAYYPIMDQETFHAYVKTMHETPIVVLDQEDKALIKELDDAYLGDVTYEAPVDAARAGFDESIVVGDSGNPVFAVVGGQLVLLSGHFLLIGSLIEGPLYSDYVDEINAAMTSLGGGYQVSSLDVSCFDAQGQPVFTNASTTLSIAENSAEGTVVGAPAFSGGTSPQFSITAGNSDGIFAINESTGQITVDDSVALNYEDATSSRLTVLMENEGWYWALEATTTVNVNITDANDPPRFDDDSYSFEVSEADATSTEVVGAVSATDDDEDGISYSIVGGNDNDAFSISSSTGEISLTGSGVIDYDEEAEYDLVIQAQDDQGSPALSTTTVEIEITDESRPDISFFSSGSTHEEDAGTVTVDVVLTGAYSKDVTATIGITNGSAVSGSDFTTSTTTVTVPAGQTVASFPVAITSDGQDESDEAFILEILSATKASVGATDSHFFTIQDAESSSGGSSGGGGGGGGGGSKRTRTTTTTTTTAAATPAAAAQTTIPSAGVPVTAPSAAAVSAYIRDLTIGSEGEDVRALQQHLNAKGFAVALSGIGSAGNESTYFGPATQAALSRYQASVGLPATGYFGSMTRALLGAAPVAYVPVQAAVTIPTASSYYRDLAVGSEGEDVRALQKHLNAKGFAVALSGIGSAGNESTYFGPATQAALARFQASVGLPATGYFGSLTRALLAGL